MDLNSTRSLSYLLVSRDMVKRQNHSMSRKVKGFRVKPRDEGLKKPRREKVLGQRRRFPLDKKSGFKQKGRRKE